MNIDFNAELKDFTGEPLREGTEVKLIEEGGQIRREILHGKALTLKTICVNAVAGKGPHEQLTPEQQIERFTLAQKIHGSNGDGLELKDTETVLIRTLLAQTNYTPLVVGQACKMLGG